MKKEDSYHNIRPCHRKTDFDTIHEAEKRMAEINLSNKKKGVDFTMKSAYKCQYCNKVHLTSMSKFAVIQVKKSEEKRSNEIGPSMAYVKNRLEYLLSKTKMKK